MTVGMAVDVTVGVGITVGVAVAGEVGVGVGASVGLDAGVAVGTGVTTVKLLLYSPPIELARNVCSAVPVSVR